MSYAAVEMEFRAMMNHQACPVIKSTPGSPSPPPAQVLHVWQSVVTVWASLMEGLSTLKPEIFE